MPAADDVIGDETEGQLKLKCGAMVALYRAEDKQLVAR
jgi:hypothetical protein